MCRRAPATSSLVIYHLRLYPNAQMITSDEEDPSPTDETALFQLDRAPRSFNMYKTMRLCKVLLVI